MSPLREALRTVRRDWPSAALAATLLAVTLGAASAMFSAVHAVLLRPLGFAHQDRVVVAWKEDARRALPVIEVAYDEADDWRARSRVVEDVAVFGSVNWTLTASAGVGTQPEALAMSAVSPRFFDVLGARAALGRTLGPQDSNGQQPGAAVISYGLWTRRFGRDPHVLRQVLRGIERDKPPSLIPIVGVMAPEFDVPRHVDVWLPAAPLIRSAAASDTNGDQAAAFRWLGVFYAVARLREGVDLDAAGRELTDVMRSADQRGGPEAPQRVVLSTITTFLVGPAQSVLWTLLAGTCLLLLAGCANVAGLQVSRAARRQRVLAIRLAIGASRRHLMQLVLFETLIVMTLASVGALGIAAALQRLLVWLAPIDVPRLNEIRSLDPRVFAFGVTMAFVAVLISASWPVLAVTRIDATSVLAYAATATPDRGGRRVQRAVVAAQIALALVLLSGASVFFRSLHALDQATLGFEPRQLLAIPVSSSISDVATWNQRFAALEEQMAGVAGIQSLGGIYRRPLMGPIGLDNQPLYPGQSPADPSSWGLNPHLNIETVTPGAFAAMGIRMLRGRGFTPRDTADAPGVVVVSDSAARRIWPGRDPIGQRLRDMSYRVDQASSPTAWQTVVGVVKDVRYRGLTDMRLDLYVPAAQSNERVQYLMVRTAIGGREPTSATLAAAARIDQRISVGDATSMASVVAGESAPWRFIFRVFVGFAIAAATVAGIGLATMMVVAVATRRRELALRAALGADGRQLRRLVFRDGLRPAAAGIALGLLSSLTLGRTIASILVSVSPYDAVSLLAAAGIGMSVVLTSCWWAARRASDADPASVLRSE